MGVFATRSPHRPNPIGLACAKIEGVDAGGVRVSGAALLDGTPVLDIKPYVPFSDCRPDASAPPWRAHTRLSRPHAKRGHSLLQQVSTGV